MQTFAESKKEEGRIKKCSGILLPEHFLILPSSFLLSANVCIRTRPHSPPAGRRPQRRPPLAAVAAPHHLPGRRRRRGAPPRVSTDDARPRVFLPLLPAP